ncbi:hypothetical protein [Fodinibius salsisoli]|uniref:Uncharacterized protein n=1 Tax=Fodinibius salsisoli TaxID=2820877 RepID=A0ABT3PRN1_9BACT|nr:hypothetical protein [Fodinibius salsisoli]MCW9708522.1 hypothetical protein [Fodinibius salsisoli]
MIKNIIAVVIGIIVGGLVNMGIIMVGPSIIAPPEGVDVTNMNDLQKSMHLFEAKHFIFPFIAHALGTLIGALLTAKITVSHKMMLAMIIGVFFLIGGIANAFMLPAPMWFIIMDLLGAYLPMAWLGWKLSRQE